MTLTKKEMEHAERLAAYSQNSQHFRALNDLMWQIPLLGMTLTGGLWFGVSKVEASASFQLALLLLAGVGNIGLMIILHRLRYIMGQYLYWLEQFGEANFVSAKNGGCFSQSYVVRTVFQVILGFAAIVSFVLMATTVSTNWNNDANHNSVGSQSYYNEHAMRLVENYEVLTFEDVHPYLTQFLSKKPGKNILDVGSGSGRDSAWMANAGHTVIAIEPSEKMLSMAKSIHTDHNILWKMDSLPHLRSISFKGGFDVIVVSAVWMHIHPDDRTIAFSRLVSLLNEKGVLYMTLRIGPSETDRSIFETSISEVLSLAKTHNLELQIVSESSDLLFRDEIEWKAVTIVNRDSKQ